MQGNPPTQKLSQAETDASTAVVHMFTYLDVPFRGWLILFVLALLGRRVFIFAGNSLARLTGYVPLVVANDRAKAIYGGVAVGVCLDVIGLVLGLFNARPIDIRWDNIVFGAIIYPGLGLISAVLSVAAHDYFTDKDK